MTKQSSNSSGSSIADGGSVKEEPSNAPTNATTVSNEPNGGLRKGPWSAAEDTILVDHVRRHGEGNWNAVQRSTGLARCGKSCRLRWANHLRPNLKKGPFSPEEELCILRLHARLGNKWARISTHLPGRTDNEIKNFWNTRLKRRQRSGLPLYPQEIVTDFVRTHNFNQNMLPFIDGRNPNFNNVNTQLLLHPSPHNFPTNGMGPNQLMNHNFQNFSHFPNQMKNDLPMMQFPTEGQNHAQYRPQMGYPQNFNPNSSMPNFPPVKTEIFSNQMYHDQAQAPRPGTNNMGGTMFDSQQGGATNNMGGTNNIGAANNMGGTMLAGTNNMGGIMFDPQQGGGTNNMTGTMFCTNNMQHMQKMTLLPGSLPQLVRGDQNSNWGNCNPTNMGGINGSMNRSGDARGLPDKWSGSDCMNNGGGNIMAPKPDIKPIDHERLIEDMQSLIGDDVSNFAWLNDELTGNIGGEMSVGGGGSVITDDGTGMCNMAPQHFAPPLTL